MNNSQNNALLFQDYALRGFNLFPTYGIIDGKCTCGDASCKSPGKHPSTKHGYKDAIEADKFKYSSIRNVAVATGASSGIVVIDVDGTEGFISIEQLPKLPKTFTVQTGRGKHYYFNYPENGIKSNQGILGKGIEIKSDGASAHLPPSLHVNGNQYKTIDDSPIAQLPVWVMERIKEHDLEREKRVKQRELQYSTPLETTDWTEADVAGMLDCLDPGMGYHDWIAVGMGLHDGGYPFSLWEEWSSKGGNYQKGGCLTHWRSFRRSGGVSMGTLIDMAKRGGWKPEPRESTRPSVDTSKVQGFFDRYSTGQKQVVTIPIDEHIDDIPFEINLPLKITPFAQRVIGTKKAAMPEEFDPLNLPGIIGETIRWICGTAMLPQPELAFLNVLAFAGSVFGRRYESPIHTRTNLYMVGIANTGHGKDHSRKMINILAEKSGLSQFIGANSIRSETGLARALEQSSSQICMLDELGLFLQAISGKNVSPHTVLISKFLMEMYSSAGGVYNHGVYADAKQKPIIITDPNLCIYGTTTESTYAASLQKSAIESGNLNRYVVMKSSIKKLKAVYDTPYTRSNTILFEQWGKFVDTSLGGQMNSGNIRPKLKTIGWGECDELRKNIFDEQLSMMDSPLGALWVRYFENVMKIAMLFAITRNPENPVFIPMDFAIGKWALKNAINYMVTLANEHMADSETESYSNEILRFIRDNNGAANRSEIGRKMRKLKKRELDDLIVSMISSDEIFAEKVETKGRPVIVYKISV